MSRKKDKAKRRKKVALTIAERRSKRPVDSAGNRIETR